MTLAGFIFAIIVALIITAIFSFGFGTRGPWGSFWAFFIILLLALMASEVWIEPVGPTIWDVAWIPLLVVGILFALLLAAATPIQTGTPAEPPAAPEEESAAAVALGAFFWIFLITLLLAILVGVFS